MQMYNETQRFSSAPMYTAAADFCPLLGSQEISLKPAANTSVEILGFEVSKWMSLRLDILARGLESLKWLTVSIKAALSLHTEL